MPSPTPPPKPPPRDALAAEPDGRPPNGKSGDLLTLEALQAALEELHVTEDELRSQNEELQVAREAVEAERARYQALFEFAPDAYFVTSPEGKIHEANRAAAELLNVPQRFLVGKPLAVFVPEDSRREFRDRLNELRGAIDTEVWEARLRRRKGGERETLLTVGPDRDRRGRLVGLRWLVRDVTAHKQAQRLAAIGEMVTGLAHESRNALQRSEACLERLRWRLHEQPEALDLVRRVQQAHDDLRRLFDDVRAYAGPLRLERDFCDLAEVWREAWAQLAVCRDGRDASLREDTGGLDLTCVADRFRLQQVFWNIFDNALAACADPVRVTVRCEEAELEGYPALCVRVRDNGPGLSEEQRRKIFEPFFTTKTKGTGLGMAIAKRIIDTHGGTLALGEPNPPGAEIVLTLPVRS